MRTLLFLLATTIHCFAIGLQSHVFISATVQPAAGGASFPSGATHYWAFENNLVDGPGSFDLGDEGIDSFPSGKQNLCVAVGDGGSITTDPNSLPITSAFSFGTWVFIPTGADFTWQRSTAVVLSISAGAFNAKIGTTADTLVGPSVTFDTWHLLVITYDGSSVEKFSVDGGTLITGTTSVEGSLGNALWTSQGGIPMYDESCFFERVLTQQEIIDMWNGGTGTFGP